MNASRPERIGTFARSLAVLAVVCGLLPFSMMWVCRWRFGGNLPISGLDRPDRWSISGARSLLAERLTEEALADGLVRLSASIVWVAVIVFTLTVASEMGHMARHSGLPRPDVRGLRISQRAARSVAAGLLVVVPALASPAAAAPINTALLTVAHPGAGADAGSPPMADADLPATPSTPDDAVHTDDYVVAAGDSVYGIAERLAGADPERVAELAEQIVRANLGREMAGGGRFTNAAYIQPGWVLTVPAVGAEAPPAAGGMPDHGRHVVAPGETLWSIAADEFGDGARWNEIFELNAGRTFSDGRTFDDPSMIHPGWDLLLSADVANPAAPPVEQPTESAPSIETVEPSAPVLTAPAPALESDEQSAPRPEPTPTTVADSPVVNSVEQIETAVAEPVEDARSRPVNTWVEAVRVRADEATDDARSTATQAEQEEAPVLVTWTRATMLAAGTLALLAVARRRRLRQVEPGARLPIPRPERATTERMLRVVGADDGVRRVERAVRAAASDLVRHGCRPLAVVCDPNGELELVVDGPVSLGEPWQPVPPNDGRRWSLPATASTSDVAPNAVGQTTLTPTLIQLGIDDAGRSVYVDLESIGALEIDAPGEQADAIVAAVGATLAGSLLAEVTSLISVGIPPDVFLGHRLHRTVDDIGSALRLAQELTGGRAEGRASTFALRAAGAGAADAWAPAVIVVGSAVGELAVPALVGPVAIVSASPITGPSSRLAPDGDAWLLLPAGVRLSPIGLVPDDIAAIVDLFDDDTVVPAAEPEIDLWSAASPAPSAVARPEPEWQILVRVFGPVDVVDGAGQSAAFERSKTRELIVWLATHRDRMTRSNARTALWMQDVRDATFANVVSEARRGLARLVPSDDGEEWIARTLTDQLPLHGGVVTDADLLEDALARARSLPDDEAIGILTPAVDRLVGIPFEGTSYLWPDAEGLSSHLVLLATSAAAELASRCLALGDTDGVFRATGRGLRVLPGHEQLIALRMRAHAEAGDHAGVRLEWESYERAINADAWSDGEPSPKLVELRRRLLHPTA